MRLYDLLQKTIKKIPNGWGETVEVDLTNGWTAPSDGILNVVARGTNDVLYISRDLTERCICTYCYAGGSGSASACAKKGSTFKINHKGNGIKEIKAYFTPFSYRGGISVG